MNPPNSWSKICSAFRHDRVVLWVFPDQKLQLRWSCDLNISILRIILFSLHYERKAHFQETKRLESPLLFICIYHDCLKLCRYYDEYCINNRSSYYYQTAEDECHNCKSIFLLYLAIILKIKDFKIDEGPYIFVHYTT